MSGRSRQWSEYHSGVLQEGLVFCNLQPALPMPPRTGRPLEFVQLGCWLPTVQAVHAGDSYLPSLTQTKKS